MNRRAQTVPQVATLACEGALCDVEMAALKSEIGRLSGAGTRYIVLDLTRVEHADYRRLPMLVQQAIQLRHAQGDLKLCGLSGYLAELFKAGGVDGKLETYGTAAEARVAFARLHALTTVRT